MLAAAGLLENRSATTHWGFCEELGRDFPSVTVEPDRIFVRDGNVFTSAGVTAGMDLALAMVEADHGVEVARAVARWLVIFVQRPRGQSQVSERLAHPIPMDRPRCGLCATRIEHELQADELRAMHLPLAQGFLFAPPLAPADVEKRLAQDVAAAQSALHAGV